MRLFIVRTSDNESHTIWP